MVQSTTDQSPEQVAEGWGLAGNWQGKLLQLAHIAGLAGSTAVAASGSAGAGTKWVLAAGLILLMVSETFWSTDKDSVGAMGRHGNQGLATDKGPISKL